MFHRWRPDLLSPAAFLMPHERAGHCRGRQRIEHIRERPEMNPRRTSIHATLLALLAVVAAACADNVGPDGPGRTASVTVRIDTPHADDRALLLELNAGEVESAFEVLQPDVSIFAAGVDAGSTRIALFGPIGDGDLLRFAVDRDGADEVTATVVEAAGPAAHLRENVDAYAIEIDAE